jgi:uncharacterized protein YceK
MTSRRIRKAIQALAATIAVMTSGCATVFVRSESIVHAEHVFPATAFDAQFLWSNGVKGQPLFAMADSNYRNGAPVRIAYSVGAILDFPLSVAFDTLLLPLDLSRSSAQTGKGETQN